MSSSNTHDTALQLECETLEPRMMLSSVQIFAAGTTGDETIELSVDGEFVASYSNLGDGAFAEQYQTLTYNTPENITAGDVRINFVNDLLDTQNGIDRNVRIDAIVIDGCLLYTSPSPRDRG